MTSLGGDDSVIAGVGYDVFLSHAGSDTAVVEVIADRLRQTHGLTPFLDRWHLLPGDPWQPELTEALGKSSTAAICVGPTGISPWQNEEMHVALDRAVRSSDEFRVIPVLLPGIDPSLLPEFLAMRTWVDFRGGVDDVSALDRLAAGVRGEAWSDDAFRLPDEPTPYRGLLRYEFEHSEIFFGREREVDELLTRLEGQRFVAIVGASGSGKSSLLRAGLIPALAAGRLHGSDRWPVLRVTPGSRPLRSLAEAVAALDSVPDRIQLVDQLTARFERHEDGLLTAVRTLLDDSRQQAVLAVDQLEEIFTLAADGLGANRSHQEQFVANLASALEGVDSPLRVVTTLRADFVANALSTAGLKELLQDHQFLLGPLDDPALREAVVRPAQQVGALYEKGLVASILRDVKAQPSALPLLQHALHELWGQRRGPWLTIDAYETIGGVGGALPRRAEQIFEGFTPAQQETARRVFLRLTTLGEGALDTKRRVLRSELYPVAAEKADVDVVLERLGAPEARLIVIDQETVELTHEALLHEWDRLQRWLQDGREGHRVHRRLTVNAHEWSTAFGRSADLLYRGVRLAEAEEWAEQHPDELNAVEAAFLNAGRMESDKLRRLERRRIRRLQLSLIATTAALVVAIVAGGIALIALNQRERARVEARAGELAASSTAVVDIDPPLAGLLAVESLRTLRDPTSSAFDSQYVALYGVVDSGWEATLSRHKRVVGAMDVSTDGRRIVTGSGDGSATVWTLGAGPSPPLVVDRAEVGAVQVSSDGSLVAMASGTTPSLWTVDGVLVAKLEGHQKVVNSVDFSPDRLLITASADGTAAIWDPDGTHRMSLVGHEEPVADATFSHDGDLIATASDDGTARIWSLDGTEQKRLEHDGSVNTAVFSPDGALVVTAARDGTARIWSVTGEQPAVVLDHGGLVNMAAFSPDGARIVTAGHDRTAKIWDRTGAMVAELARHTDVVWHADFSNSGDRVVTASRDGTAGVWSAEGRFIGLVGDARTDMRRAAFALGDEVIVTPSSDGDVDIWRAAGSLTAPWAVGADVAAADLSADGRWLVTVSDGVATVWTSGDGARVADLTGDVGNVISASFSGTGEAVTTTTDSGELTVWNPDGERRVALPDQADVLRSASLHPDQSQVATVGIDGTAQIRDLDGRVLATLDGHSDAVTSIDFRGDGGQLVTSSLDDTARLWKADGSLVAVLEGHSADVLSARFSRDGSHIVTTSADKTARVWDTTGQQVTILVGHDGAVRSADFSPDGGRIATASLDGTVRVWTSSGNVLAILGNTIAEFVSVAFTSDGRAIVMTTKDGNVSRAESWSFAEAEAEVRARVEPLRFEPIECVLYALDGCP